MTDRSLNAYFSAPLPTAPVCPGAVGQQLFMGCVPDLEGELNFWNAAPDHYMSSMSPLFTEMIIVFQLL